MRIFIFELSTGGGLLEPPGHRATTALASPADLTALVREGSAMVTALATDFAALPGTDVVILRDPRFEIAHSSGVRQRPVRDFGQCLEAFDQEAARADWTVVIAPETAGLLARFAARVANGGGRLLGSGVETIRLAGDKQRLAEHLGQAGVPTPAGEILPNDGRWPSGLSFPVVLKPRDGAGSQGIRQLHEPLCQGEWPADRHHWRVEEYRRGQAASVAVLCGPGVQEPLAPCAQALSEDGHLKYLGGRLPLEALLAERASRLAARAVATLPDLLGYVGVDLVLGLDRQGRDDVVIEINPRLTTSYVGLRVATRENLAAAILAIAAGERPALSFGSASIEFRTDGTVLKC